MSDVALLFSSTVKLYGRALKVSAVNLLRVWWLPLAHTLAAAVLAIPMTFVVGLFGIVGSFAAGLLLAFILALYLASVSAAHRNESQTTVLPLGKALFFPVIHVLFAFFIIELIFSVVARGPETYWIRASVALLIAIFANAVPETIHVRGCAGSDLFRESIEFILENWVEWFLPLLLPVLLIFAFNPNTALPMILSFLSVHPLELLERLILAVGALARVPQLWLYLISGVYLLCYVALFRAALFEELVYSTRRKRIYAERTGS